jgi:hypothetical protein
MEDRTGVVFIPSSFIARVNPRPISIADKLLVVRQ